MPDPLQMLGITRPFSEMAAQVLAGPQIDRSNLEAANKELGLTPEETFLYEHHLKNLSRGGVPNQGGISTIFNTTIERDGKHYVLPTVWNNAIIDLDKPGGMDALTQQVERAGGWDMFPSYETEKEAESRYNAIHGFMEKDMPRSKK